MARWSQHNLPAGWRCASRGFYSSDDGWTIASATRLGYRRGFAIMRTDGGAFRFAHTHELHTVCVHDTLHSALQMLSETTANGDPWYQPVQP